MVIAIDGKPLTIPFPCGLKRYAQSLLDALAAIDKQNTYFIFAPAWIPIPRQHNFTLRIKTSRLPWQLSFARALAKESVDIVHFLQQHGSIFVRHKNILTTVHDIASPGAYPPWYESLYYGVVSRYIQTIRSVILTKSTGIIAVSRATKRELERQFSLHIPIHVVAEATDISRFSKLSHVQFSRPYFLAMTDFSPRKNILRTLQAYALFPQQTRQRYDIRIVLSMEYSKNKILSEAKALKILPFVKFHYQPTDPEVANLYRNAMLFVYPSLYEGFGLPILEAMVCGCPVLTSNRGAMKETAADAALLVNPESVTDISRAMKLAISQPNIVRDCRKRGLAHARSFSWKDTAKKTLRVYEALYKNRSQY